MDKLKVLVVGCGNMGSLHAKAYYDIEGFEIAGVVDRDSENREKASKDCGGVVAFDNFYKAIEQTRPDVVSISTYPGTHYEYAMKALDCGAHVFVEKPLAPSVKESEEIKAKALKSGLKVVVGYILRHHPTWERFVEEIKNLGKPLVMRICLNQQSDAQKWEVHKKLMDSISPVVDCGVHYVDMMCLMTQSRPVKVQMVGTRLSGELKPGMYNYGQLQVTFEDGSVGWFESGWGPMISQEASLVKDVWGPNGAISFVNNPESEARTMDAVINSECLLLHHAETDENGKFLHKDELITLEETPDVKELCRREQEYLLKAIKEDIDLSKHLGDAVNSLKIVQAADESFRTNNPVQL